MPPTSKPNATGGDVSFNADAQIKLDEAHGILQHPDKFAEIFLKAATTQTVIKDYVRKEIQDSLTLDPISRTALKGLMKDQFKEDWKAFMFSTGGKLALGIWTLLVAVISAYLAHIWK